MNIKHNKTYRRFASSLTSLVLIAASLLPATLMGSVAKAGQLTTRSVTMTSSAPSATSVTYTVSFNNAVAGTVQGIVVDFCTTALQGTACTAPTGLSLAGSTQTIDGQSFTAAVVSNKLTMTGTPGSAAAANETYSFTLTATNPSTVGTFFARIFTFNNSTNATNYTSTTPGSFTDNGSVALSTTNNLTITGIITETLNFCVGTAPSGATSSSTEIQTCASSGFASAGTVGLGVIGVGSLTTTPNATGNGGTNTNGAFLIRTNAVNGATVSYRAALNSGSGTLKIPGVTCSGSVTTDGCINAAGTTQTAFSTTEAFGMRISSLIYPSSQTTATTNLVSDTEYDTTPANAFAWDATGTVDQIASSAGSATKVMDFEVGILQFGAVAAATTPSGAYSTSANFIATATF